MSKEGKIVSFTDFKKKKENTRIFGKLVWLYCPHCDTFQYTHVLAPNGRTHRCGTPVIEKEYLLDLRLEYTLSMHNFEQIKKERDRTAKKASELFDVMIERETEYANRLQTAAHGEELKILNDASIEDLAKESNASEIPGTGIFLTPFRTQTKEQFQEKPEFPENS